jgi:hypothetical protein
LSLANLCFLGTWRELQKISSPQLYYYRKSPPDVGWTLAAALAVVALALLGYAVGRVLRRRGHAEAAQFLFLVGCVLAAEGVRAYVRSEIVSAVMLAVELGVLAAALWWGRIAVRVAVRAVLVMWPLFPLVVGYELYLRPDTGVFADRRPVTEVPGGRGAARVVWLIFDELDQRAIFEQRPVGLRLDNLDRLRREASIYARRAVPAGSKTLSAIPGLVTGRRVFDAVEAGPGELEVTLADGNRGRGWSGVPNLFARVREQGKRVGIVGWYHPYCRVVGEWADVCVWEESPSIPENYVWASRFRGLNLLEKVWLVSGRQLRAYPALGWVPLAPADWFKDTDEHIREAAGTMLERLREAALAAVADEELDFVYVHWPIPHLPGVTGRGGYLDNLELTDRMLGEVRARLEQRGWGERTMLLVSSDHPFRPEMWWRQMTLEDRRAIRAERYPYVPFLVKMPGAGRTEVWEELDVASRAGELTWEFLTGGGNIPPNSSKIGQRNN